jgi:hypothetical protein
MSKHLQQLTNLFSLEIGGASTSCIYARVWMHLQRYVYQIIILNFLYESINVGMRNIRILISIVLLVLQSKRFRIFLYRRAKKDNMAISFNKNEVLVKEGVSVKDDDIIFNYTSEKDQLMDGLVPWRGAREKHRDIYQMFIESLTKSGGVVMDVTPSTCTFS